MWLVLLIILLVLLFGGGGFYLGGPRGGGISLGGIILILIILWLLGAIPSYGGEVDQMARWKSARIDPRRTIELDKMADRWQRTASRYQEVERMKANGVPAAVAFCLFFRECDNNFLCSPAQGDRLTHFSINVPKGRIPGKKPPFAWSDAAYDAYYVVDHLDRTAWPNTQSALDKIESFNGFGYRAKNVPSPYVWAGTSLYGVPGAPRGKYVRDGVFDRSVADQQLGVAAILIRLRDRGERLPF